MSSPKFDSINEDSDPRVLARYSGALHEVSNALTVVLGWLELADRSSSIEECKKAISVASEHARRGQAMARRSIGAEVESRHLVRSAAALAQFSYTSVKPQAEAQGVSIQVDLGEDTDVAIEADESVLQVLTNLLLNSIAFTPRGGTIVLSLGRFEVGLRFRVQDQGPGVPPERVDKLFDSPLSTRKGGAGIGLPLSRALAREHGGELALVYGAQHSDMGACFELTWPVMSSPASGASLASTEALRGRTPGEPSCFDTPGRLQGARVLMIEDDISITSLIELSLEVQGAELVSLTNLEEVQQTLQGAPLFDVVLLDLSPIKSCLADVLERLAELAPHAPIILMSGEPAGIPGEGAGHFTAWIRKPFDMCELVDTLSTLLK